MTRRLRRSSFGTVGRLPSGKWRARFHDEAGGRHTRMFSTKADATRWLAGSQTDLERGAWIDPRLGRTTLEDWVTRWKETTVNLRPSSRARDESYLANHVLPHFGHVPLARIDHLAVRGWVASLDASGLAPATTVKIAQTLGKVMRAAVDGGLIALNPCERVPLPRIERKEMRFLTPAEVARLADNIDERYRVAVLVAAYGGLRAGELFGLRAGRVDRLRGRIDIAEIVTEVRGQLLFGPPKTRAGRRSVPLPRFVLEALDGHLRSVGPAPEEFVFPTPAGGAVRLGQWRQRFWVPAIESAGVAPLRIHDLRHTAVAFWIAAGATPNEVAARAGHASVAVVLDRYGHLLPGAEERVNDALDQLARGAIAPTTDPSPVVRSLDSAG